MFNKKKVKNAFKKTLVGLKSGYSHTAKFVNTYAPKAHNTFSKMSHGISETFEVRPTRFVNPRYVTKQRVRSRRIPMGWRVY